MANDNSLLNFPNDIDLPFFAYGIFKPGQLAYSRIENYVKTSYESEINYRMLIRDGVPLINENHCKHCLTKGFLIYFKEEYYREAYDLIRHTEPKKLYKWGRIKIGENDANILFGRRPDIGSSSPEYDKEEFNGKNDPFFDEALELIKEDLKNPPGKWYDLKDFFKLQRNYILLWSAIERYASLKYGKATKRDNNKELAEEEIFKRSLKKHVHEKRVVYRSYNLQKQTLDPDNSISSIEYYYTIRSNIVHRGKAIMGDKAMLKSSLVELLNIFDDVLDYTFSNRKEDN